MIVPFPVHLPGVPVFLLFLNLFFFVPSKNTNESYFQEESTTDSAGFSIYELEGTYQGKDLIVINPFLIQVNSPVVKEIILNDKMKLPNLTGTKLVISLSNFKAGQYVNIKIIHLKNYRPKVQDPAYILTPSTFEVVSQTVDDHTFKFTMTHETNQQPFYVEQFKYQKWVTLGKVMSKGTTGNNVYSFSVSNHSGVNTYRVKQRCAVKGYHYSEQVEYESKKEPVTFSLGGGQVNFSAPTDYEIYELSGSIVKSGFGTSVDISGLETKNYYLNVDNRLEYLNLGTN